MRNRQLLGEKVGAGCLVTVGFGTVLSMGG